MKEILRIAIPSIISNLAIPLLGLADTAIVGHMGTANAIAAIAVGGLLFNITYWLFGFLRMGTGGLTAQACGAQDEAESMRILVRSLALALTISAVICLVQHPVSQMALDRLHLTAEVRSDAETYFRILIWGAPAVLSLYGIHGWLLGMQDARRVMVLSIVQNAVNIPASLCLVYLAKMQVAGIALGTLLAQYVALATAIAMLHRNYRHLFRRAYLRGWHEGKALKRLLRLNSDIFLRTLCLIAITYSFTAIGARYGTTTLAANALLMQFFIFFSYFMDGFAYAGEALTGRYLGQQDPARLHQTTARLFRIGIVCGALFSLLYIGVGGWVLEWLSNAADVVGCARTYLPWVACIPLVGFSAFLLDGIFIGMTGTRPMLLTMLLSTALFLFIALPTQLWTPSNHLLWVALIAHLGMRGVGLGLWLKRRGYRIS